VSALLRHSMIGTRQRRRAYQPTANDEHSTETHDHLMWNFRSEVGRIIVPSDISFSNAKNASASASASLS
jgi:hypothetical protein